ncbi:MipA/OmpV family protein [Labrys wisconsinensis]|uniref:Outer membrane scaffolding protein for murein synthesis (MipA/OmpV family) n=1 Tax=Labrys wisconsinensis TaxID=425677 RepID=A0ABU0J9H7_9HYPH|nr:MipA/OmpV family protein [Labrys wisconsinensis]MDQ0470914.1 outer membrane scaffolding protein for murein synthesis (MipA/OmpV family) [Labrys wisconsinensis]
MPRQRSSLLLALACLAPLVHAGPAAAQDAAATSSPWDLFSGDWSLSVGASGFIAPSYEGANDLAFKAVPMISLARTGTTTRFSSRNDNISFGVIDTGTFRFGPTAKLVVGRDDGTSNDLRGLKTVPWGAEVGGFAEYYPTDWLRLRGEVRHGIVSHHGVVGDFFADAFTDLTPTLRLSGGPRLSAASASYFDAYYGVSAQESLASGLDVYSPGGGLKSAGFGGALTWKATDKIETSLFAEYARLLGPAADSSLVEQRGSVDQFVFGVSATYRFDFAL